MRVKKKLAGFLILGFVIIVAIASYGAKNTKTSSKGDYSNIIVFGDSLSDNGNIYKKSKKTVPNDSTWYRGHFSNYKVWVEYLCKYSEDKNCHLIDYAYGGALSGDGYQKFDIEGKTIFKLITNFLQQVENFAQSKDYYDPNKTLYVMDIGANDIMDLKGKKLEIANNLNKAINLLVTDKNAKHIIILNIPDFSRAPRYFESSEKKQIHNKIINTNEKIQQVVNKYAKNGIDIKIVDFYKLLNDLIDNNKYVSDKPCLTIPLKTEKLHFLLNYDKTKECKKNINKYIFFDNLHPTNIVHQKLAYLASKSF